MFLGSLLVLLVLFAAQGIYRNRGGRFDAMPAHLDEPHEWVGKDHDKVWWTKWLKYIKGWFAFGPLSKYGWARWRDKPVVLFKMKGKGEWRYERDGHEGDNQSTRRRGDSWYLSRVQKWCNWHVQLQWPLFFAAHIYLEMDKPLYFYVGAHRDGDRMYRFPSAFFGLTWK